MEQELAIVDSTGEIIKLFTGSAEIAALNTPAGGAAVPIGPDGWNAWHDGTDWQPIPAQPAPGMEWDKTAKCWAWGADLDQLRALKWAEIKAARSQAEAAGFTWGALVFDSDQQSQQRIQGAVQLAGASIAAGAPFAIDWTLQDNTTATLSAADLAAVGNALAAHVGGVFTIARALREAINSAQTAAGVALIAWPNS